MFILLFILVLILIITIKLFSNLKFKASRLKVYQNHWGFNWKPISRNTYLDYSNTSSNIITNTKVKFLMDNSSGTTGRSMSVAHSPEELQKELELIYTQLKTTISIKDIVLICHPNSIIKNTGLKFINVQDNIDFIIKALTTAKGIVSYPHFLLYLCATTKKKYPKVSKIWFISEVVEPNIINNWIPKIFPNAIWQETYGCTECIPMGFSCNKNWLHFPYLNKHYVVEPATPELNPISINDKPIFTDRYLLTNYLNTIQPLVRLEIKDAGIWKTNCECGQPGLVFKCYGRTGETYHGKYYKQLLADNYSKELLGIEFSENHINKFTSVNLSEFYSKIKNKKFINFQKKKI